jgi:hypothetical protein
VKDIGRLGGYLGAEKGQGTAVLQCKELKENSLDPRVVGGCETGTWQLAYTLAVCWQLVNDNYSSVERSL